MKRAKPQAKTTDRAQLAAQFAALAAPEKALLELLSLSASTVSRPMLQKALSVCGVDPFWVSAQASEITQRVGLLRAFIKFSPQDGLAPLHPGPLRQLAVHSLVDSGRAAKVAAAVAGSTRKALIELEPPYQGALRARLRLAAALGGAGSEGLALGAYYTTERRTAEELVPALVELAVESGPNLCRNLAPQFAEPVLSSVLLTELMQPPSRERSFYPLALQWYVEKPPLRAAMLRPLSELALLRGELSKLLALGLEFSALGPALEASGQLLAGKQPEAALPGFERSLAAMRKLNGARYRPTGVSALLYLACLSVANAPRDIKRREQLLRATVELHPVEGRYAQVAWQHFIAARSEGRVPKILELPAKSSPIDRWWLALLHHWSGLARDASLESALRAARQEADQFGWTWLGEQIELLMGGPSAGSALPALPSWIEPAPRWKSALDALGQALRGQTQKSPELAEPSSYSQLIVRVDAFEGEQSGLHIELTEQRAQAKGGWSAGREIRSIQGIANLLERLPPDDNPDRRLVAAMMADAARRDFFGEFSVQSRSVSALIDHPRVFDAEQQPLKVLELEPRLATKRLPDGRIELKLEPAMSAGNEPVLVRSGSELLRFKPSPTQARIAGILGGGLALPPEALNSLLQMLPELGRALRLDGSLEALGLDEVDAQTGLIAQLEPAGEGLAVRIGLRPLGEDGPFVAPGLGDAALLGQRQGRACRARRDLAAERSALAELEAALPQFGGLSAGEGLRVETPDEALDLLLALQEQVGLGLEWKAGKPLRVARPALQDPLQIKVGAKRDWFGASGDLTLEDGSVVALAEVLRSLPSGQGRYLRLEGERVLALGEELRRRLQVLRAFADERGQVQVPAAAAMALDAALDDSSTLDAAFVKQLKRVRSAEGLRPALPNGLQAELRDYQIDGYRFLMRLAAWGGGACLADDMGLGKTVQALAMLLARAGEGPALVVAPTSLIGNWRSEARRFAPTLSVRVYGEGDRDATLTDLGAADVVLVSYGLLVANIDSFSPIEFASLVLDEAQAFKNAATQRAQAVRQIQAGFRMAATGTPLENHLGELWSLFRVLNPGLLGSEEAFRKRFLLPMERDPRGPQRDVLRRLIGPFLLRRTKAEVLSELPPRTEIVLKIEPSAGEAQLQAALRRQALQRIAEAQGAGESQRFQVLAELTRLRRAACHPVLVAPELNLPSAKLDRLIDLVQELIENRHRALVFSQFTDYLALVRERLDAEGIGYRYLDGSTAPKKREAEVNAFQRGEGHLFLLSLKAGGVGLNLTAADYVIHLDPWWNPAVEQQATDRAHRIGQTRPVTVYKLVLEGSIEEQILDMHGAKRELIDQVIGDQAQAGAIGVEELLSLLQDSTP